MAPLNRAGLSFGGFRHDVPGQQLRDAIDRMFGDAGQHVS